MKSILIVDPDITFYEKLREDPLSKDIPIRHVHSGAEAQRLLREERDSFNSCIISPEVRNPNGAAVIKFSITYQPTLPVYLLETMNVDLEESIDLKGLGVQGKIAKPFDLRALKNKLGRIIDFFDKDAIVQNVSTTDKVGEELETTEADYRSIKAELFVSGSQSLFDIYVKLRKDKFIKIVQGGDVFDVERVMDYLKKGITHFYIRKEALESYVQYCDRLTGLVSKSDSIATSKKMGFLFNQGEVTLKAMLDMGVDNDSLVHAQKYFKNTCQLVDKMSADNSFLGDLLKEMAGFEHSSAVVIVSSIVAKAVGIETHKSLETLGIAALLHDMGMIGVAKKPNDPYSEEKEKLFDEEEVFEKIMSKKVYGDEKNNLEKIFFSHCEKGAAIVDDLKGVPPLVAQIIREHHSHLEKELKRFKGGSIHPLAEILEVSDLFVRTMNKFTKANEAPDKRAIMEALMEQVNNYPRRTRVPFMEAFGFSK